MSITVAFIGLSPISSEKKPAKCEKVRAKYVMGMRSELLLGFLAKNFSAKKVKMLFACEILQQPIMFHIPLSRFKTLHSNVVRSTKAFRGFFSREVFRKTFSHSAMNMW